MGYGHCMYLDKNFDRAAFAAATEDVRTLIRRVEIKLAGPLGQAAHGAGRRARSHWFQRH